MAIALASMLIPGWWTNGVFWGEAAAIYAFGASWLMKAKAGLRWTDVLFGATCLVALVLLTLAVAGGSFPLEHSLAQPK
jgi:hypothetical protein